MGGPLDLSVDHGALAEISSCVDGAGLDVIFDPGPHFRRGAGGPKPLHRGDRHARAGNAEHQPRVVAGKIDAALERNAEVHVAELALLDVDALLARIDAQMHQEAVEDERIGIDRRRGGEHEGAAGHLDPPDIAALARSLELREQRDAIAAGHDLERHHQRLARRVPLEVDLGAIDRNPPERVVEIDDEPLLDRNAAIDHARNAVGPDFGADAARQRQIRLVLALAPSHGEHQVLGRDPLRLDVDDAVSLGPARRHGRAHLPRPLDTLRAQREGKTTAFGPRHAQIDIGERPLLAVALIVDGEVAAFEPDLRKVAAIQSAGVEALDPGEQRGEVGNAAARIRRRRCCRRDRRGRRDDGHGRGPLDIGQRPRRSADDGSGRCRRGDERALVAAGEDRDLAVRLDPHRHLGADQAQAFGANAAGEQAGAGNADFRLRRAGHDGAFRVAHHDVANAQRRASIGIAFELSAADLDFVAVAEIVLDRRGQPGRGDVELDRAAGQAPPERDHREQSEATERAADKHELAQARPPQPHVPFEVEQTRWRDA